MKSMIKGIVIVFAVAHGSAYSYSTEYVNGTTWYYEDKGQTVSLGYSESIDYGSRCKYYPAVQTNTKGSLIIPSTLGGKPVTVVSEGSFYQCESITSISFPETITTIGTNAFYKCSSLTNITIPASVKKLENGTFTWCTNLLAVSLPEGLISIGGDPSNSGSGLFGQCKRLSTVILPTTVTNIGASAFSGSGITSMTLPSKLRTIGSYAFYDCDGLRKMKIPGTVAKIGELAFLGCNNLSCVEFEGNAPGRIGNWPLFASHNVNSNCCSYVRRSSTGWNVEIPGVWQNALIDYACYTIAFRANGGLGVMSSRRMYSGELSELPACDFSWNDYAFAGWSRTPDGDVEWVDKEKVEDLAPLNDEITLYAKWAVRSPIITPIDNMVFANASQEVSISCETGNSIIMYTTDGSDPLVRGQIYRHPFSIYKSCVVRAVAMREGLLNSEEAMVTFTRSESLSEAANLYGYTMETDETHPWTVVTDVSHDSVSSVRSGAICNNGTTWLQTSIKKAGTVSFWWRSACEDEDEAEGEDGYYDYGAFLVDDVVVARIAGHDGEWHYVSYEVASGGKHTLKWEYRKDGATSYAPDCVWVDQVQWIPADGSGYTLTTPEPVPYSWLDAYRLGIGTDYEIAGNAASGKLQGGRALQVWQDYVAGTDPTNLASRFMAKIEMVDGAPIVTWEPDLNTNGVIRIYKVYGKETLDGGGEWQYPTNSLHRFFKVTVEMP